MDSFHDANILFIDEDYKGAIEKYSVAAGELSDYAPIYSYRAAAYMKLKKYLQVVEDSSRAIALQPEKERNYYRKGYACFELEEYETAKQAYEEGLRLFNACSTPPPGSVTATDYTRAIRKCDAELKDTIVATDVPAKRAAGVVAPVSDAYVVPVGGFQYQYHQSDAKLTVTVLAGGLTDKDITVDISEHHLTVRVLPPGHPKDVLVLDKELYDDVNVELCKILVKKAKVDIVLKKVNSGEWPTLEGATRKGKAKGTPSSSSTAPAQSAVDRPKAYASPKDWDQIGSDIQKEMDEEKPEGEEALQKVFKDIYAKATPETRMAMNKSFQTSGGTVLSTNWGEVGTTDYEKDRQAPKGVEWKNWEGKKLEQKEDN